MAIDIDWTSGVIFVPKADTVLVQASPSEVRSFDLPQFHQDLRTLHASVEGGPYPRTHNHIPTTVVSGFTLPRAVVILPPYTVEFEDGLYAVTLLNGNSNILDRKVPNQVSLLATNSTGPLQSSLLDEILTGHDISESVGEALQQLYAILALSSR